jgi:predicted nucleic acid-binding protein
MNVVDSSRWLEYHADRQNAEFFAPAIEDTSELTVPTLSLYEVSKRVLQQRGEGNALQAAAVMLQGSVVDLDVDQALNAARLSAELKLAMAGSVIFSTAQKHVATLWTQDADLKDIPGVEYIAKG